jgi:hypothetical protein
MNDERARHLRRLRRLRSSARRWSVVAGTLGGASAVLVPYAGMGLPDAFWAAAAGGSAVLALWRLRDAREFAALPVPPPLDPAFAAAAARQRIANAVRRLPVGQVAMDELDRHRARLRLRGLAVASAWQRLDRASLTLSGMSSRIGGPAEEAVREAAVAERSLRDLAERAAGVEKALRFAPEDSREALRVAQRELNEQLTEGVVAYERLVAAAAGYLAEDGRIATGYSHPGAAASHPATARLIEAAEMLRAVTAGLAELRTMGKPPGFAQPAA